MSGAIREHMQVLVFHLHFNSISFINAIRPVFPILQAPSLK